MIFRRLVDCNRGLGGYPCILYAPGSLLTSVPQWGSDVFGIYQSIVEGRAVPRSLLTKDFPSEKHEDLQYLVDALDWKKRLNHEPSARGTNP